MKNRIKLLLGASIALPVLGLSPVLVFAEDSPTTTTTTTTTTDKPTTLTPAQKAEIQKRVQAHKDKMQLKLAAAEQARLQARCSNAQGKISSVQGRIKGVETSRQKVYGGLVSRLTALSGKLKAQNVDTTKLDSQIAELKTKVDKFNTDLATYKQDVSDLAAMDCKTDPAGFKASLEAARTEQATLRQDATDIRTYVTGTIHPTLQAIRQQLDPKATTETETKPTTQTTTTPTTGGTQ